MNKTLNITSEKRDRLYFDRYEYSFNFSMPEMTALRELDHVVIDQVLDSRSQRRMPNFGGSWRTPREITDQHREHCHAMCDFLLAQQNYKITVSQDWGYFYTNDLAAVRRIEQLSYIVPLSIKQAQLNRPRNTLVIQNSQHEYRTYFKPGRISARDKENLQSFLGNQENIRLGPALKNFFTRSITYHYINDNFFIDHDGQGILTMLSLVRPNCVRKTVKLLRDK